MAKEPLASEITAPETYVRRREIIKQSALFAVAATAWGGALVGLSGRGSADPPPAPPPLPDGGWQQIARPSRFDTSETKNAFEEITTYNNFYELGLSKSAPAKLAHKMKLRPWTVRIEGEVAKPTTVDVDDLVRELGLEERVYRMRCVEAWSMVIPWVGFPLQKLVERVDPTSRAKYVRFTTLHDPEQLPGQNDDVLPWPYVEALRIDEATHPLAMIAVGLYGRPLLGQNGAPLRLVVPWKYGFKGGKSIVAIAFTEERPLTTWNAAAPSEYGFYANVNPTVDHPRWSQKTERRLGQLGRIDTQMFNGYGAEVAHLYSGMDLQVYF
jgi:sulfoxide reductase catalytic subunit YedY